MIRPAASGSQIDAQRRDQQTNNTMTRNTTTDDAGQHNTPTTETTEVSY